MESFNPSLSLSPWATSGFSLIGFMISICLLMGLIWVLTVWLGEKSGNSDKQRPYESGILPTGSARLRYSIPFFLMAIFFLLFDVEGVFIFTWAVACKTLGWKGWFQISFFIFILLLGLVYIWRKGGIVWEIRRKIE